MRHIALALVSGALLAGCGTMGSPGIQTTEADIKPCDRCAKIFDGKSWDGWVAGKGWTITPEGTIRSGPTGDRSIHTLTEYASFRMFITTRMAPRKGDNLSLLFWGPPPGDEPYRTALQFQPATGEIWDHFVNRPATEETRLLKPGRSEEVWHVTEIVANYGTGTMRAAVNGQEVTIYQSPDPGRRSRGPIGLLRLGRGEAEFKDIWVEVNPTEEGLLSIAGTW